MLLEKLKINYYPKFAIDCYPHPNVKNFNQKYWKLYKCYSYFKLSNDYSFLNCKQNIEKLKLDQNNFKINSNKKNNKEFLTFEKFGKTTNSSNTETTHQNINNSCFESQKFTYAIFSKNSTSNIQNKTSISNILQN